MSNQLALQMLNITKEFPGVKALDQVNFSVKKGEIHALCGENGAGKSTLMKVLSGVYPYGSYYGKIMINNQEVQFSNIKASQAAGVAIIHQELALVPEMNVAENVFLGSHLMKNQVIDWSKLYAEAQKWLDEIGLDIDPQTKLGELTVGKQQLIEIIKALTKNAEILILDEPTSALTESDAEVLFHILNQLKSQGATCIYISHKLDEVLRIADTVTVLRDGQTISTDPIETLTENDIVAKMVGRELTEFYPYEKRGLGEEVLQVNNYSFFCPVTQNQLVTDISFSVRKGEILGVSGLMGSGRTELFISLFGGLEGIKTGEVIVNDQSVDIKQPADAIKHGLAYVSEDRRRYGLIHEMNIIQNTTIASLHKVKRQGMLDQNVELKKSEDLATRVNLRAYSLEALVSQLSGGNQQKVVLSKWLLTDPQVLILDEPTRGIDVGAKFEIYKIIIELAKRGVAIMMVSSELPEVLGLSDRVIVMSNGQITGELSRSEATQEEVMKLATMRGEKIYE